jgi:hypothetical protein
MGGRMAGRQGFASKLYIKLLKARHKTIFLLPFILLSGVSRVFLVSVEPASAHSK